MVNVSTDNRLNELSAQEWLKFTKTWFIHNPPPRKRNELLHPAKYPENMVEEFIRFFTVEGDIVFDPFLGTGSTLVACHNAKRNGIGIELQKKYADIARKRLQDLESQLQLSDLGARQQSKQLVIQGNSVDIDYLWQQYSLPEIDFVVTSPPYGPMLQKKGLVSKEREEKNFDTKYSDDENDLGNAKNYEDFLQKLITIFTKIKTKVKEGGYLVVILQNYMDKGEYKMLAWDFAKEMSKFFQLRGERVWCQDNKTLYPYGYRYSFVPNVHHHYCLIFKKIEKIKESEITKNK
ncbi:MAG: DNA methyltransferase [Nanoarchaeota archaeon]|nr:site-specific DNA-methyltransferase [Nanoarchaeota archaeon]MBU1632585.1 site-specific DNA-methyltransferase [Nanoarchaeota archaeon]